MKDGIVPQFCGLIQPVNLATAGAAAVYLAMKGYHKVILYFQKAAGAVGEPPTITLTQATSIAGAGAKALNFDTIYLKSGDPTAPDFTKTAKTNNNTYAPAAGNTDDVYAIVIDSDKLDVTNGFDCIGVAISDPGATAQLCSVGALMLGSRYGQTNQIDPQA